MTTLDPGAIAAAFQVVLARAPSASEAQTYSSFSSAQGVADALYGSAEYATYVAPVGRLYTALLGRDPDPGGLDHHVDMLRDGQIALPGLAAAFLASPEAQARIGYTGATNLGFIQDLYHTALGREGEAAGVAGWLGQLDGQVLDRATVALMFATSPEHLARVAAKHFAAGDATALAPPALTITNGRALDGYIKGAVVFADANGDGVWNEGEARTTTDDQGRFSLEGARGSLVLTGGVDISTNLPVAGVLRAPEGSSVVNPLTSLQQALVDQGLSTADAQQTVARALGIDATLDLQTYDPLAAAFKADASDADKAVAVQAQAAAAKLQNLMVAASGALVGAVGADKLSTSAASDAVIKSIAATVLSDSGGQAKLADSSFVATVLTNTATVGGNSAIQSAAAKVSDLAGSFSTILAESAARVDKLVTEGGGGAIGVLAQITQVQSAVQGDVTQKIGDAAATGTLSTAVTQLTGKALDTLVSTAKVGDLDPTSNNDDTVITAVNNGTPPAPPAPAPAAEPPPPPPPPAPLSTVTSSNATLDATAIDTTGYIYAGNGINANNFHIVRADSVGLELAIKAKVRGTGVTTVNGDTYSMPTGNTGAGNQLAKWSIDFSIAADTDGNGSVLSNYNYRFLVDLDPTAATRFVTFDALHYASDNNFHNVGGTQVLNQAAVDHAVEQNSFNIGFAPFRALYDDPATQAVETYDMGNGRFDIKLQAIDPASNVVMAENAIVVLVGTGVA